MKHNNNAQSVTYIHHHHHHHQLIRSILPRYIFYFAMRANKISQIHTHTKTLFCDKQYRLSLPECEAQPIVFQLVYLFFFRLTFFNSLVSSYPSSLLRTFCCGFACILHASIANFLLTTHSLPVGERQYIICTNFMSIADGPIKRGWPALFIRARE